MKKALNMSVNLMLLLLGTFSMLMLFAEVFRCRLSSQFPFEVVLVCAFVWATAHFSKGLLFGLPVAGFAVFFLLRYRLQELKTQFFDLIDRITGVFWEQVLHPGQSYPFQNQCPDHSILFLVLALFLSLWLVMALSSHGARLHLSLIGCLPFFSICVALSEHPPVVPVIGMLLFWFLTAVGGNDYREDSSGFAAVLGCALPVALLLGIFLMLIKPDTYVFREPRIPVMEYLESLERKVEKWVLDVAENENISITLPRPAAFTERSAAPVTDRPDQAMRMENRMIWQNENLELDLTRDIQTEDPDTLFLQVRSVRDGKLYLRAVSFGDYTGTGWKAAEESEDMSSSLPFTAKAVREAGGKEEQLSIRLFLDFGYRILPYFSEEASESDSFVPSFGESRYSAAYMTSDLIGDVPLPVASEEEEAYRVWAHSVYTRLPEGTRNALLGICEQAGLSPSSPDLVSEVARYVQSIGIYDIRTQPYPSQDYALYFLTEARRGICIHFATAAAALYRALGIPARITEGFLTEARAGKLIDVTAADAHAWVEVYQDGVGWLPVEVTGQSGLFPSEGSYETQLFPSPLPEQELPRDGLRQEILSDQSDGTEQSAQQTVLAEKDASEKKEIPEEEIPVVTPSPGIQIPAGLISSPAGEEPAGQHFMSGPIAAAFCIALLAGATVTRRAVMIALRRRKMSQLDAGKAVIAMYKTAFIASRYGKEIPQELRQCAEKAAFSRHQITSEEAESCRSLLEGMLQEEWQSLNPLQKIRFQWFSTLR